MMTSSRDVEDQKAMSHVEGRDAFIHAIRRANPRAIRERVSRIIEDSKTVWDIREVP